MAARFVGCVLGSMAVGAAGFSPFMKEIPNGRSVIRNSESWYGVGHYYAMGSGPLNPFGNEFKTAGYKWTPELCAADSDGDGQSNGLELGDPECQWSRGDVPSRSSEISHPGFADSTTSAGTSAEPVTETSSTTTEPTTVTTTADPTTATTTMTTAAESTSEASTGTSTSSSTSATTEAPAPMSSSSSSTTEVASTTPAPTTVETTQAPAATTTEATASTAQNSTSNPASEGHGACEFVNEPVVPGFLWDSSCRMGMLGCNADGKNVQCRLCGAGDFAEIPCPPSSCHFANEPFVPYFWDTTCKMGVLGCWADGVHAQCRFCGDRPYTSIECPEVVGGRAGHPHAGAGVDESTTECTFANEPKMPFYWDPECAPGKLGCLADGIHKECRFCAQRPFEGIPCPDDVAPPACRYAFPAGSEPAESYFWDATCEMGLLGCWADDIHAQRRFAVAAVSTKMCLVPPRRQAAPSRRGRRPLPPKGRGLERSPSHPAPMSSPSRRPPQRTFKLRRARTKRRWCRGHRDTPRFATGSGV
mmetsp:Transcript_141659/g.453010  ORF Transcript_141659/g.453010 Transcript_141659/m.453010 type:complete len:532 (-) Transcript_141659:180-1775(-)